MAMVFSIIIVLFGLIGFDSLGVREYPSIDPPIITVRTAYTGASSQVIESQITEPIEKAINGIVQSSAAIKLFFQNRTGLKLVLPIMESLLM